MFYYCSSSFILFNNYEVIHELNNYLGQACLTSLSLQGSSLEVNVRSLIIGSGGSAKEVQNKFLVLMQDAIRQPDISKSVQRFQLAVDEANVRLNLAISPDRNMDG